MSLELYFHPLSSFCWKVLVALYENDTPFAPHIVDLGDETSRAAFKKIWPLAKFPVLRDEARGLTIPESTIIIEYLAQHHPAKVRLLPSDPDLARETRLRDRFFDLYIHDPVQRIVGDRLRPAGSKDPHGVAQARALLSIGYDEAERELGAKEWAMGDAFTMADCAAAPALHYAHRVQPMGTTHKRLAAYLNRLSNRPSFARVVREAEPYLHLFPI